MRLAAKKDDNHNEIVATFRALGCGWEDTYQLGGGFPDGLAEINQLWVLVEIKDGAKPPSARKLTPDEADFYSRARAPVVIIETVDDVIRLVNSVRRGTFDVAAERLRYAEHKVVSKARV